MVELGDTLVLEANAERRAGSSPAMPTKKRKSKSSSFLFDKKIFICYILIIICQNPDKKLT